MAGTVDEYVGKLPAEQAKLASALRAAIMSGAPQAKESIKWAQPVYEAGGPVCYFKAHKNHITFGFWRGADLVHLDPALESGGNRMAHLKLANGAPLDATAVARLVKAAVKLNSELGDPTKRK